MCMYLLPGWAFPAIWGWVFARYSIWYGATLWGILPPAPSPLLGLVFAGITLITGSLWGYPIWGTWWVWDARLTSMLVLFFFFIGYIALANGFERRERGARMAAILALIGCINLPIVKFSVDWWNTLHQPASILRSGGVAIDGSMLWPLMIMFAGFQAFFIWIVLHRMGWMLAMRKLEARQNSRGRTRLRKAGNQNGKAAS